MILKNDLDYRMDAYVINLIHRTDRMENIIKRFPELNIIRVDGIQLPADGTIKPNVMGLGMTHMKLLKECHQKGIKTVLIFEDDCLPEEGWYENWVKIKTYLDNNLDKWEVFNGGIFNMFNMEYLYNIDNINILTGEIGGGTHFLYLNLNAFDKFMTWKDEEIDIQFYNTKKFNFICCFPFLAIQDDGYSDIVKQERKWSGSMFHNKLKYKLFLNNHYLYG